MEDIQGETIALEHRYNIHRRIGLHSFVTSYHGYQDPFDHLVCITIFDALLEVEDRSAIYDRLRAAVHLASQLDTPGVLRIVDFGEIDEAVPFVVSQGVDAPNLSSILERDGQLSPMDTLALVERLAQILDGAHRDKTPHGHLGPQWIYVPDNDFSQAVVGNFQMGLTVAEMRHMGHAEAPVDAVFCYAPEAFAAGERAETSHYLMGSVASDVWALGVLAYTALTGEHPYFEEETVGAEDVARMQHPPARAASEFGVDRGVSQAIERALSREPAKRFRDAGAFAAALRAAIQPPSPKSTPTGGSAAIVRQSRALGRDLDEEGDDSGEFDLEIGEEHSPAARSLSRRQVQVPTALGNYLMGTLLLLVLSNLGWFFYAVGTRDQRDGQPAAEAGASTGVLPSGLQLETSPSRAQVYEFQDGREKLVGTTPLVLGTVLRDRPSTRLHVRHPEHREQRLELRKSDDGPDVVLLLD